MLAATLKGSAVLTGGYDYYKHLNDVWSTEDGKTWTQLVDHAEWTKRSGHSLIAFQDHLWLLAGEDSPIGKSVYFNDVWASPDGRKWKQLTAEAAWCKRTSAAAAVFNTQVFVMGGVSESNVFLNDVWSSEDGKTWTELVKAAPWSARWGFGAAQLKEQLVIMGGKTDFGTGLTNDVWSTTDGRSWHRLGDGGFLARMDFGLAASKAEIYLAGGASYEKFNDLWSFNGSQWTQVLSDSAWAPRSGLCAVLLPSGLGIFGGNGKYVQDMYNDVWSLRLNSSIDTEFQLVV